MKRVLHLLEHGKFGKVTADEPIRIEKNCESTGVLFATKSEEACCPFATGFFNGFFAIVKNQHMVETRSIEMGDP